MGIQLGCRVDMIATPKAVSPWFIPASARGQQLWHRIKSTMSPRMATQNARKPHPASGPEAKSSNCPFGIMGTGRTIATGAPHEGRQKNLVKLNQANRQIFHKAPNGNVSPNLKPGIEVTHGVVTRPQSASTRLPQHQRSAR